MTGKAGGKLVYGVGFNEGKYPATVSKKNTKEYKLWKGMLERCYSEIYYSRHTYVNCTVSDNFKNYSFFYEWYQKQTGINSKDNKGHCFELDKDILIKGNKLYSEDTCVFVPAKINALLISCKGVRGSTPVGTHLVKRTGRFAAYMQRDGKRVGLGYYDSANEAFLVYKKAKEAYIKQVAEQYKDVIDPRAYKALLEYEVNIED